MAGPTKMIIITSNEDLIRQFSLKQTTNTHIIDLDNCKQQASTSTDKNSIIDLALLAELSELNSHNDQVFKRVLDTPDQHRPKSAKTSRKSSDLICTVCGDRAIGFNYDVLSCASCKAFFRRNAQHDLDKLRCLSSHGQCSVAHGVRRKCQRCRLSRCLSAGMRKDFILTEEEKQRRKQRLEENRNSSSQRLSTSNSNHSSTPPSNLLSSSESQTQVLDDIDRILSDMEKDGDSIIFHESPDSNGLEESAFESLAVGDWITIQNVRSSFLSVFESSAPNFCPSDVSDHTSLLISWSQYANHIALRFIDFFRQIEEFESLQADDRFVLIKYNLFSLFPISKCLNFHRICDSDLYEENPEAMKRRQFFSSCFGADGIQKNFIKMVHSLVHLTEQDPTILSLLLVILVFSQGLSMSEDEPSLKDALAISRAQAFYTKLLWNYLVDKLDEIRAERFFIQLLTIIFQLQSSTKRFREYFKSQFTSRDSVEKIAPLMQTVLHIS